MDRNSLINFKNWNDQKGTLKTTWNRNDYENLVYIKRQHEYAKEGMGFETDKINFDIYGKNLSVYVGNSFDMPEVFKDVSSLFHLQQIVSNINMYKPGMILPWHRDSYATYLKNKNYKEADNIVRIIILLHDSLPGQQLWIGDKFCYGKAGSWFSWQGSQTHMAANLSITDRYVLQITGISC